MRRIIIPAAGEAVRFGGLPKELLPISADDCSLTRAVKQAKALRGWPVVVSNPFKAYWHRKVLTRTGFKEGSDYDLIVRENWRHKDMWGSIERGLQYGEDGGLILADTVSVVSDMDYMDVIFDSFPGTIRFGLFETREPERFSIVLPDRIATKEKGSGQAAWGMVMWSANATEFFLHNEFDHYDRAFEAAAREFGQSYFTLSEYHDLGTFQSYTNYLTTEAQRAQR